MTVHRRPPLTLSPGMRMRVRAVDGAELRASRIGDVIVIEAIAPATSPAPSRAVSRTFKGRRYAVEGRDTERVLAVLREHPGATASELRKLARGRAAIVIDLASRTLVDRGFVRAERGPGRVRRHFLA